MAPCTSTKSTIKCKTMPKASDALIVKKGETNDISQLIALCLQMPPNVPESDDDLDWLIKTVMKMINKIRIHVQITIVFLNNQMLAQQRILSSNMEKR